MPVRLRARAGSRRGRGRRRRCCRGRCCIGCFLRLLRGRIHDGRVGFLLLSGRSGGGGSDDVGPLFAGPEERRAGENAE